MKRLIPLALVIASTAAFGADATQVQYVPMRINDQGQTVSSPSTKTRAEVEAERLRPQATAMRINDQGQVVTPPSTKSRAEVQAELAAARATGDVLAGGEFGSTLKELHPHWFVNKAATAEVRQADAVLGAARR